MQIEPNLHRYYRLRQAHEYLGMCIHEFNKTARPYLVEIKIGKQGIAFDRLELDAFAEYYKQRNGRPAKLKGVTLWDAKKLQGSRNVMASGELIKRSVDSEFAKVLEQSRSKKPRNI